MSIWRLSREISVPLSQRGKEGGRGGRGLAGSPSPSGAVRKKAQLCRGRGSTETWLHGQELNHISYPYFRGFVLCSHQQEQPPSHAGKGKGEHLQQGLGVETCLEGMYQLSPSSTKGHRAGSASQIWLGIITSGKAEAFLDIREDST